MYVGNVYVLGVAICPSYPIIRHDVMYVEVGVVTGSRVLIPAAHCFRGSAESFNLSAAEARDQDRLGSTFNLNIFWKFSTIGAA